MNIKKFAVTAAATGMMLSAAVPAFASHLDNLTIVKNENTNVFNGVLTLSNTGLNGIFAGNDDVNNGSIITGNANAWSSVFNMVNTNVVDLCGCLGSKGKDSLLVVKNDNTHVDNYVLTVANTGLNGIFADDDANGGSIRTGGAGAGSIVENVVNTNVVGGSLPF